MSYKKTTFLILISLLITTYAHDHSKGFKCGHDHQIRPDPEFYDIGEEFNPNGNNHEGRMLANYSSLRTYGYYGIVAAYNTSFSDYVQNQLIPPILDYFAGALKNKYPVSGLYTITTSTICSVSTPAVLKSGIYADFVYFVDINNSTDYVASTSTCLLATGSKRPLAGKTTISTTYMSATTDVLLHERNMICIMHEVIHALGFSTSMYGYWVDSNGKTLTGHILSDTLDNITTTVINAEPLTTKLRNFFGCSTLMGAYMENTGGSGTVGSHFERRQFGFEIMSSGLIYEMQVSPFTLAILESTGWYVPDYSYADAYFFGQGQGCNFLNQSCSDSGFNFDEFCTGTAQGCTNPGRGGGSCTADSRSDGCTYYHPNINYDCENTDSQSYARLPTLQTFGRGANSKCFTGTLTSSKSASSTSFCFTYSCSGSGSSTQLTINVGSTKVNCTAEGTKTVSGYNGVVNCPDPLTFCSTVGQKICPRGCMGRGTCVNGVCACNSGFKGTDCALTA